jgi:hypothetical protein
MSVFPLEPATMFPFSVCRGFYRASAFPLARELFNVFLSGFMRQVNQGGETCYKAYDSECQGGCQEKTCQLWRL